MSKSILAINRGSSSLKFAYFKDQQMLLHGEIENLKHEPTLWVRGQIEKEEPLHTNQAKDLISLIIKVIEQARLPAPQAFSHRLVFGGSEFTKPTLIDKNSLAKIKSLSPFAPLHLPLEIEMIEIIHQLYPNVMQIACFDTSFHATLPNKARRLAIPQIYDQKGYRRYGFHGLSFESIIDQIPRLPDKVIIAHLGSGCSLAAIHSGKSIDTTMGLSPLGGVLMSSRPGDIDPGVLLALFENEGLSHQKMTHLLYNDCGLKGISDLSSDLKTLLKSEKPKAKEAIECFTYQIAKVIGSYLIALGGIDLLVFTGGIGERSPTIRKMVIDQLNPVGVLLDDLQNEKGSQEISTKESSSQVIILPAQEEKILAAHAARLLKS